MRLTVARALTASRLPILGFSSLTSGLRQCPRVESACIRWFVGHCAVFLPSESAGPVTSLRYIYVARDPLDAFVSFYHFLPAYMGIKAGEISVAEFADAIFAGVSVSG